MINKNNANDSCFSSTTGREEAAFQHMATKDHELRSHMSPDSLSLLVEVGYLTSKFACVKI